MQIDYTRLSVEELKEHYARLGFLIQTSQPSKAGEDGVDLLHACLDEVLVKRGASPLPLAVAKRQPSFKLVTAQAGPLLGFINQHFKPKSRVERLSCLRLLIKLLVRRLERSGVLICYSSVTKNLTKAVEELEEQFPGYRESGLLPIVLASKRYRNELGEEAKTR